MSELHYKLDLLKAMNQKLTEKERMYRMVCDSAEGAFLYYSFDKSKLTALGQWREYFSFEIAELSDLQKILDAVEDEGSESQLREVLYLEKKGEEHAVTECFLKERHLWLQFRTRVYYDHSGRPTDKVIYITNVTKQRHKDEELLYMAYYDSLTGLYNRNYFVQLLSEYIRKASETNSIVSVMNIDIDEFNKVNDGLGIVMGDELVQQFGMLLKDLCQENVIACHLHRDVYCIAIYDPAGTRTAEHIYKAIKARTKQPFLLSNGSDVQITVSVGVAEYPEAARSALELINYAELVVFRVKAMGRNGFQYFNAPILDDFLNSVEVENRLRQAVTNRDFELYYQPQYYTGNMRLRGVEALIRWHSSEGEVLSPDTFIPVAEKNGSIVPIGKWVVEESVRQYSVWRQQFGFPFIMSINISALQYKKDDFVDFLLNILNKYQVKPFEIELEITESVLIDDFAAVSEKLKLLRGYGIRISLDDFGTGFSSLSYLKKLPIDTLKIDKSFIDTVLTDSSTRVITESILNMVKALGFESIAEGVEQEQQYKYLHSIGCDVLQGYLFSKPLPAADLEKMIVGSLE